MVGCNHDTWLPTPMLWFELAETPEEYGVAFTGSREVSDKRFAPQSAMNEMGLTFSRLVAYHPEQVNPFTERLAIKNEVNYLSSIMHQCATIQDVKEFIEQYDHSFFLSDVFIYIDSTGKYLVVEPYNLIEGDDQNYLLSNFCPSITSNEQARRQERFENGQDFIQAHPVETSLDFCTALSDTMHVCRKRNGDGTLLTSIWDTKNLSFNLYFYHNFDTTIQYNLKEELVKGNRLISLPELFPANTEFERLKTYKTPSNTVSLRIALLLTAGLLCVLSFGLVIGHWKFKPSSTITGKWILIILLMNILLIAYLFVLLTNKSIFYFDAPYLHPSSLWISASSYIPFILLVVAGPIMWYILQKIKSATKAGLKTILLGQSLLYLIIIFGFMYWGLYHVWG